MSEVASLNTISDAISRTKSAMLADHAGAGWCSSIVFAKGFFRSEPIKGLDCAIGICRVTIPSEVVRIDFHLDDLGSVPLRDESFILPSSR